ncbi:STT3 domain-containing protein [Nitratifractor sp.]
MDNWKEFPEIREWRASAGLFSLLLIVAYLFATVVRYYWLHWASGHPEFFWNGQVMINTNDGYYWAEGARDLLAGLHQSGDLSPVDAPVSMLTAFLAKILPFSFETVILWMPALFGSLLVAPILLIGRTLRLDHVGFIAAMLGGVVWSYYNRTMIGYYDTDMLTIVLPTFVLWGMILAVLHKRNRYMALTALLMVAYQWYYPAAYSLNTAFVGVLLLYTLIFEPRERYNYKLLLFMLVALLPLGWEYQAGGIALLFVLFHFGGKRSDHLLLPLLLLGAAAFLFLGGLDPVWYQLKGYLFRESVSGGGDSGLHFYAVSKTVREAGKIPFEIFANRISGDPIIFVLSLIGYLMMALRYRVMWLALPMLGLGFLAMKGGLRFTVYAVPPMALGMGYLAVWFAQRLAGALTGDPGKERAVYGGTLLAILTALLYPNLRHVVDYKVPTVFTSPEVKVLAELGKKASREDYVLAWWDYGYPIRYYSDVKTLIDGGKHSGDVNYPVSFALSAPQVASANMARLDVEYTERSLHDHNATPYLAQMMRDYHVDEPALFLNMLSDKSFKLPPKRREIYYYLPLRMLGIFPTVALFSSIDLQTGRVVRQPTLYQFFRFAKRGETILFGQGLSFDTRSGIFYQGNSQTKLNSFVTVSRGKDGKLRREVRHYDREGKFFLVHMADYRRFLLLDKAAYESTYIQLFVLENYDPELFEPVILGPMAKIYRLKR